MTMNSKPRNVLSCLDCRHCRLYYVDQNEKRFCCDLPRNHTFYVTNPDKTHSKLCDDFSFCKRTSGSIKINFCEKLQDILTHDELDEKGYFRFDTHEKEKRKNRIVIHRHINEILEYVDVLENNKSVIQAKELVDSYFKMAAYGFQRIAEIEVPESET